MSIGNDGIGVAKPVSKTGDITGGDYLEVEADGTDVRHGDATLWDDLTGALISQRLSSTAGKLDYDYDENAITMQSGGNPALATDRLMFNYQFPHAARVDSSLKMHVHWEQVSSNKIECKLQYRIQSNNSAKTTSWTTIDTNSVDNSVFTYVSGTLNQITEVGSIDMTGAGISATVQFRLTRFDATAGDILATFVDAHVERDMIGSRQEYVK